MNLQYMKHDNLGAVVKNARIHKGLSQEQLAEQLDCSVRHIMGIENESKKPSYERLYQLIRILDISADDIFYPERFSSDNEKSHLIENITDMLYRCDIHDITIIKAAVTKALELKQP